MAEYAPLYKPGQEFPRTTSGTVTAGQLLIVSGSDTVAASSAASAAWLGVAAHDAASGADVTVICGGVHELGATGAISAGADVVAATAGTVATVGAGTAFQVVGVALSDAASSKVVVKLAR